MTRRKYIKPPKYGCNGLLLARDDGRYTAVEMETRVSTSDKNSGFHSEQSIQLNLQIGSKKATVQHSRLLFDYISR